MIKLFFQLKVISFTENRYEPLKSANLGGIIMLKDKKSGQPVEYVELVKGNDNPSEFAIMV